MAALAQRVQDDDFFLASALALYARTEQLGDQSLAEVLGCDVEALNLLRICRRPRTDDVGFRQDLQRISNHFDVQIGILAEAIRRAEALSALRQGTSNQRGLMMAARDRIDEEPTETRREPS